MVKLCLEASMAASMLLTLRSPQPVWPRREVVLGVVWDSGSADAVLDFFFFSVVSTKTVELIGPNQTT